MTGTAFIVHESGWACSNLVYEDTESDIEVTNGAPAIRQRPTLKLQSIFNGIGSVLAGQNVKCVMKDDETGKQHGIAGVVEKVGNLTVINITGEITDYKSIIKNIK